MTKPLALLSVSDKSGIVDFGSGLVALGYEIFHRTVPRNLLQSALA